MSTLDPIQSGKPSSFGGAPFIDAPGARGTDTPAPELDSITPNQAQAYTVHRGVTITGLRMSGANPVLTIPSGWNYENLVIAANGLSATLDLFVGPASGDFILTTDDGVSNALGFTVTGPAAVTVSNDARNLLLIGA